MKAAFKDNLAFRSTSAAPQKDFSLYHSALIQLFVLKKPQPNVECIIINIHLFEVLEINCNKYRKAVICKIIKVMTEDISKLIWYLLPGKMENTETCPHPRARSKANITGPLCSTALKTITCMHLLLPRVQYSWIINRGSEAKYGVKQRLASFSEDEAKPNSLHMRTLAPYWEARVACQSRHVKCFQWRTLKQETWSRWTWLVLQMKYQERKYVASQFSDLQILAFCFLYILDGTLEVFTKTTWNWAAFKHSQVFVLFGLTCAVRMLPITRLMLLVILVRGVGQAHCRLLGWSRRHKDRRTILEGWRNPRYTSVVWQTCMMANW